MLFCGILTMRPLAIYHPINMLLLNPDFSTNEWYEKWVLDKRDTSKFINAQQADNPLHGMPLQKIVTSLVTINPVYTMFLTLPIQANASTLGVLH